MVTSLFLVNFLYSWKNLPKNSTCLETGCKPFLFSLLFQGLSLSDNTCRSWSCVHFISIDPGKLRPQLVRGHIRVPSRRLQLQSENAHLRNVQIATFCSDVELCERHPIHRCRDRCDDVWNEF